MADNVNAAVEEFKSQAVKVTEEVSEKILSGEATTLMVLYTKADGTLEFKTVGVNALFSIGMLQVAHAVLLRKSSS